jgi:transcriptional regulator with XRE-family HTH domain
MRTALKVESKTAEKLRQLADALNVSVDQLLAAYVPGLASEEPRQNGSDAEDKAKAFEEWAASFPTDTPPLSDEAVSRASIYRDR